MLSPLKPQFGDNNICAHQICLKFAFQRNKDEHAFNELSISKRLPWEYSYMVFTTTNMRVFAQVQTIPALAKALFPHIMTA